MSESAMKREAYKLRKAINDISGYGVIYTENIAISGNIGLLREVINNDLVEPTEHVDTVAIDEFVKKEALEWIKKTSKKTVGKLPEDAELRSVII